MMDRRSFVKTTCALCSTGAWAVLLDACESTRYVTGTLESNGISVAASEFNEDDGGQGKFRPYVVVRNDQLEYPICVYRFSSTEFSALLMKCTHQGTELQVAGDHLHCPAHGSEFSSLGKVAQGPAELNLRTFRVTPTDQKVFIEMK